MTDQNYDPEAGITSGGSGKSAYGNAQSAEQPGSTSSYSNLGSGGNVSDAGSGSDDASAAGYGSGVGDYASGTGTAGYAAGTSGGTYGSADDRGTVDKAKDVAGHAADRAADVKDTAVAKAGEVKDTAVERGADVAAVAKDELARLTSEARGQVQDLWAQASTQLRDQVDTGRQQLADLLHSLADELGEMASKSTQSGPVTTLAKQAAHRGGELSHWLANTEPGALLNDVRRFARRRPVVFLGSAALAGVLVGRLGRSLMASAQDSGTGSTGSVPGSRAYGAGAPYGSMPATAGVSSTPAASLQDVPEYGTGQVSQPTPGYTTGTSSVQAVPGDTTGGGWR